MADKIKLTESEMDCVVELIAAEAHYLRVFGWVPLVPIVPGAPIFWRDPMGGDERSEDVAMTTQKARVVDILYRN
jgi:hypothetical protein